MVRVSGLSTESRFAQAMRAEHESGDHTPVITDAAASERAILAMFAR